MFDITFSKEKTSMNIKLLILSTVIIILIFNYKRILSFIKYIKEQRAIEFKKRTNLNLFELNRLSAPHTLFFFGLGNYFFPKPVLYFDENNLIALL